MELETGGKFNVLPPRPYASCRLHTATYSQLLLRRKNYFYPERTYMELETRGNFNVLPPR
jgi:hypothetical protein